MAEQDRPPVESCNHCGGFGFIEQAEANPDGYRTHDIQAPCPYCGGDGYAEDRPAYFNVVKASRGERPWSDHSCHFCGAAHRNPDQPGGCVIYWQGRTNAEYARAATAEAERDRLLGDREQLLSWVAYVRDIAALAVAPEQDLRGLGESAESLLRVYAADATDNPQDRERRRP